MGRRNKKRVGPGSKSAKTDEKLKKRPVSWAWSCLIAVLVTLGIALWFREIKAVIKLSLPVYHAETIEQGVFPLPDHTFYRMALNLDVMSFVLRGHSIIDTKNTSGRALTEIWLGTYPNVFKEVLTTPVPPEAYYRGFDSGWLKIDEVYVNQVRCEYEDHGPAARILLETPIEPGETMTLDLRWRVKIPKAAYRLGGDGQVFLLAHAYPVLNVLDKEGWHNPGNYAFGDPFYSQCADYLVQLVVPEAYRVVSTGEVMRCEAEDSGKQVITVRGENIRDFSWAAFLGGEVLTRSHKEVLISCYFRPGKRQRAESILDLALKSLDYYQTKFGPYSYRELDIVEAPMAGFNGMEFSGMIFLHEDIFAGEKNERKIAFLVAHEVAHQWWYGAVGSDQENEPWLDEGLANWSAHHCLKHMGYSLAPSGNKLQRAELQKGLKDMATRRQYLEIAYLQGQDFWFALEKELGEEAVMELLRTMAREYRFRTITGEELRSFLQTKTGHDVTPILRGWFH